MRRLFGRSTDIVRRLAEPMSEPLVVAAPDIDMLREARAVAIDVLQRVPREHVSTAVVLDRYLETVVGS